MYTESITLQNLETHESESDLLAKDLENCYSSKEFRGILKTKLAEYYENLQH